MTANFYETEALPIVAIHKETPIDWTFTLAYSKQVMFGQFMQLSLPGIGEAPISISDWNGTHLFMTIRNVGVLTKAIFEKKVGDTLFGRGPYGHGFDVHQFKDADLIVIAGGTGLAPVRGFLRYFVNNPGFAKSVHLIAGFKSPADVLFAEDLQAWQSKIGLDLTVDKAIGGWTGKTGLVTEYLKTVPTIKNSSARAVVVGPPIMMKFATLGLLEQGMKPSDITVSYERNMSCGAGKCGHCKIDSTYVCVDGPVFSFENARHLID